MIRAPDDVWSPTSGRGEAELHIADYIYRELYVNEELLNLTNEMLTRGGRLEGEKYILKVRPHPTR